MQKFKYLSDFVVLNDFFALAPSSVGEIITILTPSAVYKVSVCVCTNIVLKSENQGAIEDRVRVYNVKKGNSTMNLHGAVAYSVFKTEIIKDENIKKILLF